MRDRGVSVRPSHLAQLVANEARDRQAELEHAEVAAWLQARFKAALDALGVVLQAGQALEEG